MTPTRATPLTYVQVTQCHAPHMVLGQGNPHTKTSTTGLSPKPCSQMRTAAYTHEPKLYSQPPHVQIPTPPLTGWALNHLALKRE